MKASPTEWQRRHREVCGVCRTDTANTICTADSVGHRTRSCTRHSTAHRAWCV